MCLAQDKEDDLNPQALPSGGFSALQLALVLHAPLQLGQHLGGSLADPDPIKTSKMKQKNENSSRNKGISE